MKIYVLIIVCIYTLDGLFRLAESVKEQDKTKFVESLIAIVIGILAIVFQSINL